MKKKSYIKSILAISLVVCMTFIGVSAYLNDADTMTNEFAVGQISLKLEEPNWNPSLDEDNDGVADVLQLKPLQVVQKNPQIYNDGQNDENVFMTVTIPKATVKVNGSTSAEPIELFTFEANTTEVWETTWDGIRVHKYDEDWILIDKTEDANSATYIYAYFNNRGLDWVSPGETTPTLFDEIKFADVDESEYKKLKDLEVVVNAYGIQRTNVKEFTEYLGDNDGLGSGYSHMSISEVLEVWQVIKNAKGITQ